MLCRPTAATAATRTDLKATLSIQKKRENPLLHFSLFKSGPTKIYKNSSVPSGVCSKQRYVWLKIRPIWQSSLVCMRARKIWRAKISARKFFGAKNFCRQKKFILVSALKVSRPRQDRNIERDQNNNRKTFFPPGVNVTKLSFVVSDDLAK